MLPSTTRNEEEQEESVSLTSLSGKASVPGEAAKSASILTLITTSGDVVPITMRDLISSPVTITSDPTTPLSSPVDVDSSYSPTSTVFEPDSSMPVTPHRRDVRLPSLNCPRIGGSHGHLGAIVRCLGRHRAKRQGRWTLRL